MYREENGHHQIINRTYILKSYHFGYISW